MTDTVRREVDPRRLHYLRVDPYLNELVGMRSLATALELGLIDALARGPLQEADLPGCEDFEPRGRGFLLDLLCAQGVIARDGSQVVLAQGFRECLVFRDLIEAKISFAMFAVPDFLESLTHLLQGQAAFMPRSRTFELFRYDRCFDSSPENLASTRRWVRITTALTRYEAPILDDLLDWSDAHRVLDIGGNSGELLRSMTHRHPGLEGTVFDLPVVCQVGREYLQSHGLPGSVEFVAGDVRQDGSMTGFDRVIFKSFLHDWPASDVPWLLEKAFQALRPGGSLVIFERSPLVFHEALPGVPMIHSLVFLHCYHSREFYRESLAHAGFIDIQVDRVDLEMPFHLIEAKRSIIPRPLREGS